MNTFGITAAAGAAIYAATSDKAKSKALELAITATRDAVVAAVPKYGHGSAIAQVDGEAFAGMNNEQVRHAIYQAIYDQGAFVTKVESAPDGKLTITANRTTAAQAVQDKFMAKGLWT